MEAILKKYADPALAAAFVRGAAMAGGLYLDPALAAPALADLRPGELAQLLAAGEAAGLRMYHFKQKELLPRVKVVMGNLRGIQPESLLDVGSGRGAFLFPFLSEFPWIPVTAVDLLPHRVQALQWMHNGGLENLTALEQDICTWDMAENAFDVVTLLEVLEHIPDVQSAVCAAVKLARRYVVVSVPSKPDNNPEHIHLLTKERLTGLFANAGCRKLHFSGVNGHLILLAAL